MSTAVCSATCCISREPSPRPRQEGSQIPIAMGNVGDKAKRRRSGRAMAFIGRRARTPLSATATMGKFLHRHVLNYSVANQDWLAERLTGGQRAPASACNVTPCPNWSIHSSLLEQSHARPDTS